MITTLTIHDETMYGQKSNPLSLDFLTERITVRELIRERVYEDGASPAAGPTAAGRRGPLTFRSARPTDEPPPLPG